MAYKKGNYTANHTGVAAYLRSEELAQATQRVADEVAQKARELAPRSNDGDGIPYADGIVVERDNSAGIKGDRVGWNVVATTGHPTLVEWGRKPGKGSPGYEGQHVMKRATEGVTE